MYTEPTEISQKTSLLDNRLNSVFFKISFIEFGLTELQY